MENERRNEGNEEAEERRRTHEEKEGESRQELPLYISGGGLKNNYDGGEDEGGRCS